MQSTLVKVLKKSVRGNFWARTSLSVRDDTFPRRRCMLHVEIVLKTKQTEAETSLVYDVLIRVIKKERELNESRKRKENGINM